MMQTKLIGISGKKGSGKTTLAKFIQNEVPGSVIINFADALKDEVCKACEITYQHLENNKPTYRTILQWWGTEFRRKFYGDDYWLKKWLKKIIDCPSDIPLIICSDIRFMNEFQLFQPDKLNSPIIRIERPDIKSEDLHPSETNLDNAQFQVTIQNNSNLNALEIIAKDLVKSLLK